MSTTRLYNYDRPMMRLSIVVAMMVALSPTGHSATAFAQRSVLELEKRIEDRNNKRGLEKGECGEEVASDVPAPTGSGSETDRDSSEGIDVATIERTFLFSEPTGPSERIAVIPKGACITVLGPGSQSRAEAVYLELRGYVSEATLDRSDPEIAAALDALILVSRPDDPD
jgi:hypothetical protein